VIQRKLESLRRHVARIQSKQPFSLAKLEMDEDLQDIIAQNLTQAVQVSVDIGMHILAQADATMPETMAEVFGSLGRIGIIPLPLAESMAGAVGFRNIAVHTYEAVNWKIVYAICQDRLSDFSDFARRVAAYALGSPNE
jgi:uncharacterized protein YutE (UPF0331/DUF86 family)